MKMIYLELAFITILISLLSISPKKYENRNLKKFLSNLGPQDVPSSKKFLNKQYLFENENNSTDTTDDEESSEEKKDVQEEEKKNEQEEEKKNEQEEEKKNEQEEEKEEEEIEEEKKGEQEEEKEEEEIEEEKKGEQEEEKEEEIEEDKGSKHVNIKCLWVDKYNVYSLQELQDKKKDYEKEFNKGKVFFNFCQNLNKNSSVTVIWERNDTNESTTVSVAGSIDGDSKSKNNWAELPSDEPKSGLMITLAKGEVCKKKNGNVNYHQTYFKIYCDENIDDDDFLNNVDLSEFYLQDEECKHYIKAYSIYGCALNDWYLLRRLMNENKYLFGIGLILIGLFFCMWGKKFHVYTMVLIFGIVTSYMVTIIILNFFPSLITTEKSLWILLVSGFIIGAFIGFALKAKITILTVLLGASMGYSVAEIVYQFISGFIEWNPQYLYYSTIGVCVISGIIIGFKLLTAVLIIGTSLVGGYISMRGVALIFGHYMDEKQFADLVKSGELEELKDIKSGWTYAYIGLWLILTIFGTYYQCIGHKKDGSTSKETNYKKIEDKK